MTTGREIVAQLSPSDFLGTQKAVLAAKNVGDEIMLGTVYGMARGLSYRHNPQDESKPSIAIVGPFKFIPFDEKRTELWATRCFLPSAFHEVVVTALKGDDKAPIDKSPKRGAAVDVQLRGEVPIVLEVGARKTEGGVGYEYIVKESPKKPIAVQDPLALLESEVTGKAPPRLAAPAGKARKGAGKRK